MATVGRPKNAPTPKKMLKEIFPVGDIFSDDEIPMYNDLIDVYLSDFDTDELTSSDMDDIMDLAKNRILEFRLLKESKGNPDKQIDVAQTVERLSKKNEKIKESLSSRRKDRVNPNEFKGFSIVDLAVAFTQDKRINLKEKMDKFKNEEIETLEKRKDYCGNKNDMDMRELGKDNE